MTPPIEQSVEQATPRPWRIVPEKAKCLIFEPKDQHSVAAAIATTNPNAKEKPFRWLTEAAMLSDAEYKESEQEGWHERQVKEAEANAELIVRAVNAYDAFVDALSGYPEHDKEESSVDYASRVAAWALNNEVKIREALKLAKEIK
jgi:hypothetical protein